MVSPHQRGYRSRNREAVRMTTRVQSEAMEPLHANTAAVEIDEPPRPSRIRSRSNAIRALACLCGLGLVLLLPSIATQTTTGIQTDIQHGTTQAPHILLTLATLGLNFGVLAVPVIFAVDRVIRRDGLRVA